MELGHTTINIVVSIKPFYNLVAAITKDTQHLSPLVTGKHSPHNYSLKPSDLKKLATADLIVWGGENIEPFLAKFIVQQNSKKQDKIFTIENLPGLEKLPLRSQHCSNHTTGHNFDPHIWLSIQNAKIIVENLVITLSKINPSSAKQYTYNARIFLKELTNLEQQLLIELKNIKQYKYVFLHDAYQYFEKNFSITPHAVVSLHPESPIGIRKLKELRKEFLANNIQCLFAEQGLNPSMLTVLAANSPIMTRFLDPIGKDQDLGPNGYLLLIGNLANELLKCCR